MVDFSAKDTMPGRDRLGALAKGQPIDRVPFTPLSLGLSARLYGVDRGEFYRNPDVAFEAGLHLMKQFPWMVFRPVYGWVDRGTWEFGGQICWPDGDRYSAPFSPEPVITTPLEVDSLPDPNPETAGMNPLADRFNHRCQEHGFRAMLPGGTPTAMSSAIVGIIEKPVNFERLMAKIRDLLHERECSGSAQLDADAGLC